MIWTKKGIPTLSKNKGFFFTVISIIHGDPIATVDKQRADVDIINGNILWNDIIIR